MSSLIRSLLRRKRKKKYQIAIVGLDQAGKTTIVNRLIRKEYVEGIVRTMGVNTETVTYKNVEFSMFDLGGQQTFREFLWDEYVVKADAIIYVLDSADLRLKEASEAFWQTVEVGQPDVPLLFLANKDDLPDARPFDAIIADLDLGRAARERKFGIFRVSAKTGYNFYDGFDWLTRALTKTSQRYSLRMWGSILAKDTYNPVWTVFGSKTIKAQLVPYLEIFNKIKSALDGESAGMDVVTKDDYQLVLLKRQPFVASVICSIDDPIMRARLVCERTIHNFLNYDPRDEITSRQLTEYIQRSFPLDIEK
ncbi:MAG: ADP-ribosylation factor family protein [Candidatus Hodarchaeota archaeon]